MSATRSTSGLIPGERYIPRKEGFEEAQEGLEGENGESFNAHGGARKCPHTR